MPIQLEAEFPGATKQARSLSFASGDSWTRVSTIEDAYYMAVEYIIESPKIFCIQARKVHSLLQHHMVHHSYLDKIQPQIPYRPNSSKVPLK